METLTATRQTPTSQAAARQPAAPRGSDGFRWPAELMAVFGEQMEAAGLGLNLRRMQYDRLYALRMLAVAHTQADDTLRYLAVQLFRHFEGWQSGVPPRH